MVLVVLAGGASACVGGSDGLVKWTSKLYALISLSFAAIVRKASGGSSSDAVDNNTMQGSKRNTSLAALLRTVSGKKFSGVVLQVTSFNLWRVIYLNSPIFSPL